MPNMALRGARDQFAAALTGFIALAGLAMAGYGVYAWHGVRADQYADLDNVARLAARSATLFYDRFDSALGVLGEDLLQRGRDQHTAHQALLHFQQTTAAVSAVNVFDMQGNWLLSSLEPAGSALPATTQPSHRSTGASAVLHAPGLSVSRPALGVLVPARVIELRRTVHDATGNRRFVLCAVVPLRHQQKLWTDLVLPQDAIIGIVRSDGYFQGRFSADLDEEQVYSVAWKGAVVEAVFGRQGSVAGHIEAPSPLDGVHRYISYQRLQGYPLAAFVGIPRHRVWLAWLHLVQVPFALFALLAVGGIAFSRHLGLQYEAWAQMIDGRQRRLQLLNRIATNVNHGTPFLKLVDDVLAQLANQLPHLRVSFAELQLSGKLVPVCACAGSQCEYAGGTALDLARAPALLDALRAGTPSEIADTAYDARVAPIALTLRDAHVQAWLLLPMVHSGELIGVLSIESHLAQQWTDEFIALTTDVTAQLALALTEVRAAEQRELALHELAHSRERFRDLAEMSSDWFWEQDAELRYTYLSPGAQLRLAERPDDWLGKRPWEIPHIEGMSAEQWHDHAALLKARQPFTDLVYRYRLRGELRHASTSGKPIYDSEGHFTGYRGTGRDITAQRENEARIQYLAHNDELTGLPNRSAFQDQLTHAIRQSQRHGRPLALLFIDLDRFKNINDTLGHGEGDRLLQEVARRLANCLRESDTLARWGGDEFTAMLEEFESTNDVALAARRVLDSLSVPYLVNGRELVITASVGIGTYPDDGQDMQSLLKAADIAMYRAKQSGKNNFQYYAPQMNVHTLERLTMEANLRRALEREEFLLHYQPKIDLRTGTLSGAEALIRWQHPDLGLVPPMQFISLAEETGLIEPMGNWVLRTACAQAVAWQSQGLQRLRMAVNISGRQFAQGVLLEEVIGVLDSTGLDPDLLELEITESMLMHDPDKTVAQLNELKAIGIHLAIDDFGTGYSSLSYLKRFPVSSLKIDRSFVQDVPFDPDDVAITLAIVGLAHNLRIRVTAEGVETEAQRAFLRRHGCDEIQGYLIGRPLPAHELVPMLQPAQAASDI